MTALLDPGTGLTERLVTLPDGRRLRTVVAGEAPGPLVVFEAGMSAPAASWVHTQREVSRVTRTLSYDRAGYGGSDVDPRPRTLERIADDLLALLDAVGETSPVVLVGHSWGGPVLRLFADRHPERVAGLVFVDASLHEGMPVWSARVAALSFRVMSLLIRVGAREVVEKVTLPHGFSPEISEADRVIQLRDYISTRAMRAATREGAQIIAALPTMRALQDKGTPAVPTVCVQGGRIDRGMATLRPALNQAVESLMAAVQGRVVVVPEAGHLVPQEAPGPVRDAIVSVVEAVRVRS
jgi:pimeloyl-ACP methyl ester carboxylesterase